jgi:hypothetical protein
MAIDSDLVNDLKKRLHDASARAYILAMKRGEKPDEQPEMGEFWKELIADLERQYAKFGGNAATMTAIIDQRCKEIPALADLLKVNSPPARGMVWIPELPESVRLDPALGADACPELDIYINFSREASPEGYEDFHMACGMWLFSIINARRSYLQLKQKRVYGNLMFGMCSDTSDFAKSTTANVAKAVLFKCGLGYLLGPNRITPQKLLSDMAGAFVPTNYNDLEPEKQERVRRRLSMPGQKGLIFDEFGKFVQNVLRKNSTNADFADIFLELDACPEEFETSTISRGGEPIERPYIALLGSMTPPNLKDNAKSGADFWTDGFWARFSFIVAIGDPIDCPLDAEDLEIPGKLVEALQQWHGRLGVPECYLEPQTDGKGDANGKYKIVRGPLPEQRCTITDEAHNAWKAYRSALKALKRTFPHKDFHGSYARLPETALRMAVLMASLSNGNRIEMKHWVKAQELAEVLRRNLHQLYAIVNLPIAPESEKATIEQEVEHHLRLHGPLTLNTLRNSYMKKRSVKEIEEALRGLKRIGTVVEFSTSHAVKYQIAAQSEDDETN